MSPWWVVATTIAPRAAEVIHDGDAEAAAFGRIGPGADLVEQDERRRLQIPGHLDDRREMGREGREVFCDGLLVADVGEDPAEHGKRLPASAGTWRPLWAMRARRPRVLTATVFPPVLGPLITSTGVRESRAQAHRNGLRTSARGKTQALGEGADQQGMPGVDEFQLELFADLRLDGLHVAPEERHGLHEIQLPEQVGGARQVGRAVAHSRGQSAQDPDHLGSFLVAHRHDVVVQRHGRHGLDEQARPGTRAAVDDALGAGPDAPPSGGGRSDRCAW